MTDQDVLDDDDQRILDAALPFARVAGHICSTSFLGTRDVPHLGVFGAARTGKSVTLRRLTIQAVVDGWEVNVFARDRADYAFAKAWQFKDEFAQTPLAGLELIRKVYQEMTNRLDGRDRSLSPFLIAVDGLDDLLSASGTALTEAERAESVWRLSEMLRLGFPVGLRVVLSSHEAPGLELAGLRSALAENAGMLLLGVASVADRGRAFRIPGSAPWLQGRVAPGEGVLEGLDGRQDVVSVWVGPPRGQVLGTTLEEIVDWTGNHGLADDLSDQAYAAAMDARDAKAEAHAKSFGEEMGARFGSRTLEDRMRERSGAAAQS